MTTTRLTYKRTYRTTITIHLKAPVSEPPPPLPPSNVQNKHHCPSRMETLKAFQETSGALPARYQPRSLKGFCHRRGEGGQVACGHFIPDRGASRPGSRPAPDPDPAPAPDPVPAPAPAPDPDPDPDPDPAATVGGPSARSPRLPMPSRIWTTRGAAPQTARLPRCVPRGGGLTVGPQDPPVSRVCAGPEELAGSPCVGAWGRGIIRQKVRGERGDREREREREREARPGPARLVSSRLSLSAFRHARLSPRWRRTYKRRATARHHCAVPVGQACGD